MVHTSSGILAGPGEKIQSSLLRVKAILMELHDDIARWSFLDTRWNTWPET